MPEECFIAFYIKIANLCREKIVPQDKIKATLYMNWMS